MSQISKICSRWLMRHTQHIARKKASQSMSQTFQTLEYYTSFHLWSCMWAPEAAANKTKNFTEKMIFSLFQDNLNWTQSLANFSLRRLNWAIFCWKRRSLDKLVIATRRRLIRFKANRKSQSANNERLAFCILSEIDRVWKVPSQ